ncbi:MAG: alpha/beta hydrolase [Alphaproteobacteria bacterium]|nr:alpha/beta hydrolase [Alphaproteobacteria bacterium]
MAGLIEMEDQPLAFSASGARPLGVPEAVRATHVAADRYGFVTAADGAILRFGVWRATTQPARGSMLVLTGRGEFIDKYASEVIPDLLARGFAVYALDWRGQGLSARQLEDRQKGHIDTYDTYLADLQAFLGGVVTPDAPRPIVALTHSMGGHLLLRHLAEHQQSTPVAAGILGAPMTGLRREAIITTILTLLPPVAAVDERYFYGSAPFRLIGREFVGNKVTHDERRYRFTEAWFDADSRLALGGPTVGWLRQTLRSIKALSAPGYLEPVRTPLLMVTAGQDLLIDGRTHDTVAASLPDCTHLVYADARHEIMMETDQIRARFFADVESFLARHAPAQ